MPENVFVKFKNLIRETCNMFKLQFVLARDEQTQKEEMLLKDLDKVSIKSRKKTRISKNVYEEIIDIEAFGSLDVLRDLISIRDEVDKNRNGVIKMQSLINAFDNEKCICYVKDIYTLLLALVSFVATKKLSTAEATQILGATIYFNSKKSRKNKGDSNEVFYKELERYFNYNGTFKYCEDLEGLYYNLKGLFNNHKGFSEFERICMEYKSEDFAFDISNLYLDFYRDYPTYLDNETDKKVIPTFRLSDEVRKYYKDGKLLSIPEDIDAFLEELYKSNLSGQEIKYILSLIRLAKSSEHKSIMKSFYTDFELELVSNAGIALENMKSYEGNYYEIKEILVELQTLESMFADGVSGDDEAFILEEKDAYVKRLHELITPKEEQELVNIAFLKDSNGVSYFHKDLDDIDKSLRKRCTSLLSKINNDGKKYFRKVYPSEALSMDIYEVLNPDVHIIFTEIPGNIFLIIGVSTTGNNYREITNRLVNKENQRNILDIIEAIKDENVKKNYLLEQNAMIPSFSDKRVRKQIDN